MMQKMYIAGCRFLLLICCLFCAGTPAGAQLSYYTVPAIKSPAYQLGFKYAYLAPLGNFGAEFKRAPEYELYFQMRNKGGAGHWSARVGVYYTAPAPRLDSFPVYLIRESNTTTLFPGYVAYHKFYLRGLFIEYAYRVFSYKGFSLDAGLGLSLGQYRMEYSEGYATILTSENIVDEKIAGLRVHASAAYQLNKYIELYVEGMNSQVTQTDWSAKFPNNSFGAGLNVTLNPKSRDDNQ